MECMGEWNPGSLQRRILDQHGNSCRVIPHTVAIPSAGSLVGGINFRFRIVILSVILAKEKTLDDSMGRIKKGIIIYRADLSKNRDGGMIVNRKGFIGIVIHKTDAFQIAFLGGKGYDAIADKRRS